MHFSDTQEVMTTRCTLLRFWGGSKFNYKYRKPSIMWEKIRRGDDHNILGDPKIARKRFSDRGVIDNVALMSIRQNRVISNGYISLQNAKKTSVTMTLSILGGWEQITFLMVPQIAGKMNLNAAHDITQHHSMLREVRCSGLSFIDLVLTGNHSATCVRGRERLFQRGAIDRRDA